MGVARLAQSSGSVSSAVTVSWVADRSTSVPSWPDSLSRLTKNETASKGSLSNP